MSGVHIDEGVVGIRWFNKSTTSLFCFFCCLFRQQLRRSSCDTYRNAADSQTAAVVGSCVSSPTQNQMNSGVCVCTSVCVCVCACSLPMQMISFDAPVQCTRRNIPRDFGWVKNGDANHFASRCEQLTKCRECGDALTGQSCSKYGNDATL